jgi:pimeloyl-ACP methyl ester carboxylesterase
MIARSPPSPVTRYLTLPPDAGGVTMAVHEHGPRSGRPVVCVHGLTRNGHDFDWLGAALARRGRYVLAPDMPGRGHSGWLADPAGYGTGTYIRATLAMLRSRGLTAVDWVGTSMGGIIGMAVASMPENPIRRLVLNDVGAMVPKAALEAIATYVGLDPRFGSLDDAERYIRETHAGFGSLTDAHWRRLTRRSVRRDGAGYRLRYDPAIRTPFAGAAITDVDLWRLYDAIRCPVLLLRGASSGLLPASVAREMATRGPKAKVIEFAGAGHAPALIDETQIAAVAAFVR